MPKPTHRLRIPVLAALLASSLTLQAGEQKLNTLSSSEKKSGWELLFDGQSADQWRNYRKDELGKGWEIRDGLLMRAKGGAGDIITREEFGEFELSLEYRISKGGNSGIMFHVTEQAGAPWQTGPEIQIQDNKDGHDPQKAGWLYQLYKADTDATRPAGEWNHVHLRVTQQQCEINMNGVRYARFVKGSADWNRRVAASKFSKFPLFGKPTKGHICLQDHGNPVAFRNIKIRRLTGDGVSDPIDGNLPYKAEVAFPKLQWTDWSPVDDRGKAQPLRPIVLTYSPDDTNRVFVATQRGVIHAFENRQDAEKTQVFLDITDKVSYDDKQNEEGLLGFAFHPDYRKNGEFYIYYTTTSEPNTSVISRFRVSADDPSKADPKFEEELLRIKQPFWNHNGGTIAFGPDKKLYIGLGDGGAANDPHENAQNLSTLLGSILRIDVDSKSNGKPYGIPADNPFVGLKGAKPEIWAYGLRNVWRLSFDRETGTLWAADVGQNLWEEINIITRGGNYGWNLREATHPFGSKGTEAADAKLIDPIWEYDHQVGKSVTGGMVYRGDRLPELVGTYLYADYITGKVWGLKYDEEKGEVVSNKAIDSEKLPIISFGDDAAGDVYFTVVASNGRGIYRFVPTGGK